MERSDGILYEASFFESPPDPYELAAKTPYPYQHGQLSKIYQNYAPEKRKKVNEDANEQFRRVTGFTGKLDPNNPAHKELIWKWFRIRDVVMQLKMRERDTLSREINDLNKIYHEDPFLDVSRIQGPYTLTPLSGRYQILEPDCRKKVAQEVDKELRRVTGFVGTLPSLSNARNERERYLIRTWLRFRDIIVGNQLDVLCPGWRKSQSTEPPAEPPPIDVDYDPYHIEILEKIDYALRYFHGIGTVAEIVEWVHVLPEWPTAYIALQEGTPAAQIVGRVGGLLTKLATSITAIATILTTIIELYAAFTFGRRLVRTEGFCYALVCKAAEKNLKSWDPLNAYWPTSPDTLQELQQAFHDGTTDGIKEFDTNAELRSSLIKRYLYQKLIQSEKYHWSSPESRLLNDIWEQVWLKNKEFRRYVGNTHLYWEFNWGTTYSADKDANDGKPPSQRKFP